MQTNQNPERRADGYSTAQNEADGFEAEESDHSFVCRKGTRSKSVSTSTTLIRIIGRSSTGEENDDRRSLTRAEPASLLGRRRRRRHLISLALLGGTLPCSNTNTCND